MNRRRLLMFAAGLLAAISERDICEAAGQLFETGVGHSLSQGVLLNNHSWYFHRFEVKYATQLATVGGGFQRFNASPISVFGAVVGLNGPEDIPNSNNLSTSDRLGTTLLTVGQTGINGADFSAPLSLSLQPGWYGLVFGTGAFGAGSTTGFDLAMPDYAIDTANSQNPMSFGQPSHPTMPNFIVTQLGDPRFFATAEPPGPQMATFTPAVNARATLSGGLFGVTDGDLSIGAQYLPIASVDSRSILEFDLRSLPRGSTVTSASLDLEIVSFGHNDVDYPIPKFFGYKGDGLATPADTAETATLLHQADPITALGPRTFPLDPAFFQTHAGVDDYGGILIRGGDDGHSIGFRTTEAASFASPPKLKLAFTPPPEPLSDLGDYNRDSYPNTADYTVWRDTLGSTTKLHADGNRNGVVDPGDLDVWKQAFVDRGPIGLQNADFDTGSLVPWTKVITPNGAVTAGFPRVESFDVDGDGQASPAMRIRGGVVTFSSGVPPAGGGIEQEFILEAGGDYTLSAKYASTNIDTTSNGSPGIYHLIMDGILVDDANLTSTIVPGQVMRGTLSGQVYNLGAGRHTIRVLFLRAATNSREIYGYVDNLTLVRTGGNGATQVPEPSTVVLIAFASGAIICVRRRAALAG